MFHKKDTRPLSYNTIKIIVSNFCFQQNDLQNMRINKFRSIKSQITQLQMFQYNSSYRFLLIYFFMMLLVIHHSLCNIPPVYMNCVLNRLFKTFLVFLTYWIYNTCITNNRKRRHKYVITVFINTKPMGLTNTVQQTLKFSSTDDNQWACQITQCLPTCLQCFKLLVN